MASFGPAPAAPLPHDDCPFSGYTQYEVMQLRSLWSRRLGAAAMAFVPPPSRNQLPRRVAQLFAGLLLYGVSDSLLVLGTLGLDPWDVFHQGLSLHTGIPIGTWSILVGGGVLLLWIPLRQRPGLGTLANVVLIGSVMDVVLAAIPAPHALLLRALFLATGVFMNGVATGCYIGAGLGPGPRDGLMVGLAARGHSLRVVRTAIELTVLAAGWLLGGDVGLGTVVYALAIGPLAHVFIPRFTITAAPAGARAAASAAP